MPTSSDVDLALHRAINSTMRCSTTRRRGWLKAGDQQTYDPERHGGLWPWGGLGVAAPITVRLLAPTHPYAVSRSCIRHPTHKNRIHIPRMRFIATTTLRGKTTVKEIVRLQCGATLVEPLYLDEPERVCECGKPDAEVHPQCWLNAGLLEVHLEH
jgi:hypothetical protein